MTFNGRMMSRVPTWAELRLDATKLAELQRECYRNVHDMLDVDIPELDRKLSILSNNNNKPRETKLAEVERPKPINTDRSLFVEKNKEEDEEKEKVEEKKETRRFASNTKRKSLTMDKPELKETTARPIAIGNNTKQTHAVERPRSPIDDAVVNSIDKKKTRKLNIVAPKNFNYKEADETDATHDQTIIWRSLNYNDYEHLRPLPMPLNYYLKLNRPNLIREADRRVAYLKRKVERRKVLATERTINALDQMRISSRASSNKRSTSSLRSSMMRSSSRDSMPPSYQVKYNFSEQEMKRLTAKIYNRLPEVKKQRNQEVTKHLKVQNYKNKMDYGRKLVENRRRGIINYPLKSNFDESSVMSSQEDDSLTNSLDSASLDYFRAAPLFEWTFFMFVANFTLQLYQFAAQLATFIFDRFKLAYSREIFGQLTNDDLKPYTKLVESEYELLFKLAESVILTIAGYFIAKSLLNFSLIGLVICLVVFISHALALVLGAVFLLDQFESFFSTDAALWFVTIFIEISTVALGIIVVVVLFGLY